MANLVLTERGPLVVAETTADADRIQKELIRLDPELVLLPHKLDDGRWKWGVHRYTGPGQPPVPVCYWDHPVTREPWPLTFGLVDKVRGMMNHSPLEVAEEAAEQNRRLLDQRKRDSREVAVEVFRDGVPRTRETRSAVLPRSIGLRMARDRRRARGEMC